MIPAGFRLDYKFTVHSRVHGDTEVTAPRIFKDDISQRKWHLHFDGHRTYVMSYVRGSKDDKKIRIHRLIWRLLGRPDTDIIDHADRNPLNNSLLNLRAATASQNGINVGVRSSNTSGCPGVTFIKRDRVWRATLNVNRRRIHIGEFPDLKSAMLARNAAARVYQGEFAVIVEVSP